MEVLSKSKVDTIRDLNDTFRKTFVGGRLMLTASVANLPPATQARVLTAIQQFKDFSEDNDPHGEHDFVSVEVEGEKYFAKMDYYAPDMEHGSEDPADPKQTTRVLTIMRADDY